MLHSLYQVKDYIVTNGLRKESFQAWERILRVQRELALVNPIKNQFFLLEALDGMVDAIEDFWNIPYAFNRTVEAAVKICRELDNQGVPAFTLHLVDVLQRMVVSHFRFERPEDFVALYRDTINTLRKLATQHDFEEYTARFGRALDDFSMFLLKSSKSSYMGISLSSESVITNYRREAVDVWRRLAIQNLHGYTLPLIKALDRLAECLVWQDIVEATKLRLEAVNGWRNLAAQDPDRYTIQFAWALEEVAEWVLFKNSKPLRALGTANDGLREAIDCQREAIDIWRKLAIEDGDEYVVPLLSALYKMSNFALEGRDPPAGRKCRLEIVDIWRNLAALDSDRHPPQFAQASKEMADWASSQIIFCSEAIECLCGAVGIWQKLAAENVDEYVHPLLAALYKMSDTSLRQKNYVAARRCRLMAVGIWRDLSAWDHDRYTLQFARALGKLIDWASRNKLYTVVRRQLVALLGNF